MTLTSWAAMNAEQLLAPLEIRWSHVQKVGEQARLVAEVVPAEDRDLLIAAAYLHDVGYSPDLVVTGFHPLDGARWIRDQHQDERLARLVAHHSCSTYEAQVRGLLEVLLAEFEPEETAAYDALVFCDMTTGPTGKTISFEERIEDIYRRYGPGHEVSRALDSALPCLQACHDRTIFRLVGRTSLADIGSVAAAEVMLETKPY